MNDISLANNQQKSKKIPFNWGTVSFLFCMFGIPSIPAIFIVLFVFAGVVSEDYVSSFINAAYYDLPVAIIAHGLSGIAFFLTVPLQFSSRLRIEKPSLHKRCGYIASVSACIMAISGVWMHLVFNSNASDARFISLCIVAFCICSSYCTAIYFAVKRNIKRHQCWIYYAIASSLAVVTPLFIDIFVYLLIGSFESWLNAAQSILYDYGRVIALILNLGIAYWLNEKR